MGTFVCGVMFGILWCAVAHKCPKRRRFVRIVHGLYIATESIEAIELMVDGKLRVTSNNGRIYFIDNAPGTKSYEQIIEDFELAVRDEK